MENKKVDPITMQVISGALDTIAEEMGHVLYRMSFSSIIRESQDLGAGLFDRNYQTICESESTPMHIGSIPAYLRGVEKTLQDGEWYEGDVVVHNHPYYGSSHTPDLAIIIPVFYEGELVGFSANTAHHIDIGAATPGLIIDVGDVYAEGMLFAGLKLYEQGKKNAGLEKMITANSRASQQLMRDIEAQVASAQLGVMRFKKLLDKYGKDRTFTTIDQLIDYSETMLRKRIAEVPDGEYQAQGFLDDDGRNREVRLPVVVTVRVEGDSVTVDLTGSADQTPTAYNVPFEGSCKVAAFAAFRKLLLDSSKLDVPIPSNEGSFRPINVVAPEGSIFNPIFPAATEARFTQCNMMIDLIIKALAPVLPEQTIAGSSAAISFASYAGMKDDGEYWVFLEVNEGAYGGRPASDGPDAIDNLMANTRNNPIEDLGMHLPMICDRYELRDDVMPGAGKHRGGIGVVKSQRVLTPGFITHESERHYHVPWGAFGGSDGAVGKCEIYNYGARDEVANMPSKFSGYVTKANDVMAFYAPCGGGYGNPLERSPEQVREDVLDDFCTVAHAYEAYGVVLDDMLELDCLATAARRSEMGA
ncbi:hydantoinase B/oxoprolinase family protein [Aidingimonas lacisalsi]|uniref:hydantoinase B/oxoprolinase family protein n=1 Tax=Aidingimonas lacisalsi TaxID=2604086 RepID=UPI0011D29FBB|nr:hydantoinase B/oxoprolinase family protein [Aidingimonas lacisalsi]